MVKDSLVGECLRPSPNPRPSAKVMMHIDAASDIHSVSGRLRGFGSGGLGVASGFPAMGGKGRIQFDFVASFASTEEQKHDPPLSLQSR